MKKSIIQIIAISVGALLWAGCSKLEIAKNENGFSLSRTSFGTKIGIKEASVTVSTNGTQTWTVKGMQSDQVEAFQSGVELGKSLK